LKIKVAPGYLPEGQDSKTQVQVGTRKINDEIEVVTVYLWINNGFVFSSHPEVESVQKRIQSYNSVMELEVNLPVLCLPNDVTMIVLSSDGKASEDAGSCLGQFVFDPTKQCWIQSNDGNYQEYVPRFIYKVDDAGWFVSDEHGKKDGWLGNDARTNTLPLAGWKYCGAEDPTLSITIGPLETNCDSVNIKLRGKVAEWYPETQGLYKKQNMMWQGHHVFKNSNNKNYLYVDGYYSSWAVGSELGDDGKLRGTPVHSCLSKATRWRTYGNDVEITCSCK